MICSSVNRFFTSNLLSMGLDSKLRRYSNPGGRRDHGKIAMATVKRVGLQFPGDLLGTNWSPFSGNHSDQYPGHEVIKIGELSGWGLAL